MDMFKIREWLSDNEFKELLEFSDYLGYRGGYKVFRINYEKMRNNGYTYRDILAKLKEYNADLDPLLEKRIEELSEYENTVIVEYDPISNSFTVSSQEYLKPYLYKFSQRIVY
ncbi:MAG: hypothetical protein GSR79_02815, partial [Desulfurococcales archaeon]|nr:hypothetical protein [Desulfurococcales archaeon]